MPARPMNVGTWEDYLELDEESDREGLPDDLPMLPGPVVLESMGITNSRAAYAGVGMVLFAMCRYTSNPRSNQVADNRPKALIKQFGLSEEERRILPGESYGPAMEFLNQVPTAFSVFYEVRGVIIREFMIIAASTSIPSPEVTATLSIFRLLQGTQLTHLGAILDVTRSYPWMVKIPKLTPYYEKLCRDMAQYSKLSELERAYHRLIERPDKILFVSRQLEPLVAVATEFKKQTEKSFEDYGIDTKKYSDLIAEIQSHVSEREQLSAVGHLISQLGVPDVDVPQPTPQHYEDEDRV
jgi:hypothetical protein